MGRALTRPDGTVTTVVADVSGHGPQAGLVALRFKQRLTALLRTELDLLTVFDVAAPDWSPAVAECSAAVRRFAGGKRRDDVTCVALSLNGHAGA